MGRFDRHALIAGWDQRRLAASTVVLCGAGALGSQCAQALALAGVGRAGAVRPGHRLGVEPQPRPAVPRRRHRRAQGCRRGPAPRRAVPGDPRRRPHRPLVSGVGLAELRDASLVVSCLDSLAARLQLAGRCLQMGAALLDGGTSAWGGEIRLYEADGPCFGCGLTARDRAAQDDPWACTDAVVPEASCLRARLRAHRLLAGGHRGTAAVRRRPRTRRGPGRRRRRYGDPGHPAPRPRLPAAQPYPRRPRVRRPVHGTVHRGRPDRPPRSRGDRDDLGAAARYRAHARIHPARGRASARPAR
ncbi:ThiF family adenylyltransferase [Streptomyces lasalocidi]